MRRGEKLEGINTFSFIAGFNGQFYAKLPKAFYTFLDYQKSRLWINISCSSRRQGIYAA